MPSRPMTSGSSRGVSPDSRFHRISDKIIGVIQQTVQRRFPDRRVTQDERAWILEEVGRMMDNGHTQQVAVNGIVKQLVQVRERAVAAEKAEVNRVAEAEAAEERRQRELERSSHGSALSNWSENVSRSAYGVSQGRGVANGALSQGQGSIRSGASGGAGVGAGTNHHHRPFTASLHSEGSNVAGARDAFRTDEFGGRVLRSNGGSIRSSCVSGQLTPRGVHGRLNGATDGVMPLTASALKNGRPGTGAPHRGGLPASNGSGVARHPTSDGRPPRATGGGLGPPQIQPPPRPTRHQLPGISTVQAQQRFYHSQPDETFAFQPGFDKPLTGSPANRQRAPRQMIDAEGRQNDTVGAGHQSGQGQDRGGPRGPLRPASASAVVRGAVGHSGAAAEAPRRPDREELSPAAQRMLQDRYGGAKTKTIEPSPPRDDNNADVSPRGAGRRDLATSQSPRRPRFHDERQDDEQGYEPNDVDRFDDDVDGDQRHLEQPPLSGRDDFGGQQRQPTAPTAAASPRQHHRDSSPKYHRPAIADGNGNGHGNGRGQGHGQNRGGASEGSRCMDDVALGAEPAGVISAIACEQGRKIVSPEQRMRKNAAIDRAAMAEIAALAAEADRKAKSKPTWAQLQDKSAMNADMEVRRRVKLKHEIQRETREVLEAQIAERKMLAAREAEFDKRYQAAASASAAKSISEELTRKKEQQAQLKKERDAADALRAAHLQSLKEATNGDMASEKLAASDRANAGVSYAKEAQVLRRERQQKLKAALDEETHRRMKEKMIAAEAERALAMKTLEIARSRDQADRMHAEEIRRRRVENATKMREEAMAERVAMLHAEKESRWRDDQAVIQNDQDYLEAERRKYEQKREFATQAQKHLREQIMHKELDAVIEKQDSVALQEYGRVEARRAEEEAFGKSAGKRQEQAQWRAFLEAQAAAQRSVKQTHELAPSIMGRRQ